MDIIYLIIDTVTNNKYLGSKKDWQGPGTYFGSPSCQSDSFKKFKKQQDWKIAIQERPESFIFDILENFDNVSHKFLFERELYWQQIFNVVKSDDFINIKFANPNNYKLGNLYEDLTDEEAQKIKNKISKSLKEKYSKLTEKERREKFVKIGKDNPNYGNTWSDEQKEHLSKIVKNDFESGKREKYKLGKSHEEIFGEEKAIEISQKLSKIASQRIGELNPFFGKSHTEETIKIISENHKGKYFGDQNIPFTINDVLYSSLGEASKKLSIPIPTIRWRILSKNKKFDNYKYILLEDK